jgi:hypothetical protein
MKTFCLGRIKIYLFVAEHGASVVQGCGRSEEWFVIMRENVFEQNVGLKISVMWFRG